MPVSEPKVGYVLKMYPRFSETFILNEILALESRGVDLEVFSLRPPVDGRFHEALAQVRGPVSYLTQAGKPTVLWETLRQGEAALPAGLGSHLPALLSASPGDACQAVELARLVHERGITHLHAHFGSIATTVARLAAALTGVPYSFTAHAKDIFHQEVDTADLRDKLADASAVVTVSDFNLAYLQTMYGDAADRAVRIYNGLDLDAFGPASPRERPNVVAGVGRLVEKKGFDRLVDAIGLLVKIGREIRLDLVGAGVEEEALRAQVSALGLDDAVRFLGPLPQGQAREVIRGAAVLAAPCVVAQDGNRDGLPTVVLEGMALGTPVVATPVTGIPEAVVDGETGIIVPEDDVAALAAAVARLLDDADLRCSLAASARRMIEDRFDIRRSTQHLHHVLAGPPPRTSGLDPTVDTRAASV